MVGSIAYPFHAESAVIGTVAVVGVNVGGTFISIPFEMAFKFEV